MAHASESVAAESANVAPVPYARAPVRVLCVGNIYPPQAPGGGYELTWRSFVAHMRDAQRGEESKREHARACVERAESDGVVGEQFGAADRAIDLMMRDVVDAMVFVARSRAFGVFFCAMKRRPVTAIGLAVA